jgi:ABC-type spermidine/putrescine transport system permease subunit II
MNEPMVDIKAAVASVFIGIAALAVAVFIGWFAAKATCNAQATAAQAVQIGG